MTKFDIIVACLAGLAIAGLIVLKALKVDVGEINYIATALVSFLLGLKKDAVVAAIRR